MMYECLQYRKRNHNQFWSSIGQIYTRRIIILICVIIGMYSSLHIIQTGLFLYQHFIKSEDVNDMIKLDVNLWQHGSTNDNVTRKIPRYIHQIWISSTENNSIPEKFRKASDSCIELHSNYNYTLWTHNNILIWLK
jgi:mannosyltransferase OCH1-like enzyme